MSEVFWVKLYCKMSDLFASFYWLWDYLLENLKLRRNSDDVCWNIWMNIKKLYAQNNIFKKRIPNMTFWIIYILVQVPLLGTSLGRFSHCFFLIFHLRPTMMGDTFTQPHYKKASYGPDIVVQLAWLCHYKTATLPNLNLLLQASNALGQVYLKGNWCHKRVFCGDTSFLTVMGTFNSDWIIVRLFLALTVTWKSD